ncbi:VENN motif pre-toxin domain-containing protein [Yersinia massiliensis]|uniref:VENN motif pre-toxin domain-containing protein n=1 Tax=Yersinia massiliensis TaxID=419257 RepID=UPI0002EBCF7E|nr:VENN motif pre-toxin domain-containing protein [Yersinia massiliensis]
MTGVSVPNPASASQLVQAQGGDSASMPDADGSNRSSGGSVGISVGIGGSGGGLSIFANANTVAGAQAGKNAVENNALSEIIGQQVSGVSEAEKYQNAQKQIKASMTKFLCHDNISSAREDRFLNGLNIIFDKKFIQSLRGIYCKEKLC